MMGLIDYAVVLVWGLVGRELLKAPRFYDVY